MGKRTIYECDLTKQEFDPEEEQLFTITVAKKGRKAPMKYEISAAAAEKLLAQLNGSKTLPQDWHFTEEQDLSFITSKISSSPEDVPQTLGDLDDDADFVAHKKKELREAGVIEETDRVETSVNGCSHMNKGPIQATMKNGKRYIYRICKDCHQRAPEMTKQERDGYLNGKAPADVNIRDISK
jgi:hypothetical protein